MSTMLLEQHRAGHRADAAGVRRDPAGHAGDVVGDIAGDLALDPRHADVEHGGAGLDHVAADDAGYAGSGDHDVGLAHVGREVLGPGVAQRHGRVLATPGEQQPERAADRETAADHDHLGTGDLHAVAAEQLDHAHGRAGQRSGLAEHQLAQVGRVQAVDVLVGMQRARAGRTRRAPLAAGR